MAQDGLARVLHASAGTAIDKPRPAVEAVLPHVGNVVGRVVVCLLYTSIIVEMDDKGDRREIEMGSYGGTVGEKVGIRADRIVRTSANPVGGRRFKVTPVNDLKKRCV